MKKISIFTSIIFIGFLFISSKAFAFKNGDFQVWNTETVEIKLNKSWKVSAEEELKFGNDVSQLYYAHTDGGLIYKVTDGLDVGLNYRQIYEKDGGKWRDENRPHVNATVKWKWKDFTFKDRNRLEYRMRRNKDDKWRYRNKLTAVFPWKWTQLEIQPYAADEIFVDFHGERLYKNRVYAGVGAKLLENLKLDIYYLWQIEKDAPGKWTNTNAIGIKLKAAF